MKLEKLNDDDSDFKMPESVSPQFTLPSASHRRALPPIHITKRIGKPVHKYERKSNASSKKSSGPFCFDMDDPSERALLDSKITRLVDAITSLGQSRSPLQHIHPNVCSVHTSGMANIIADHGQKYNVPFKKALSRVPPGCFCKQKRGAGICHRWQENMSECPSPSQLRSLSSQGSIDMKSTMAQKMDVENQVTAH